MGMPDIGECHFSMRRMCCSCGEGGVCCGDGWLGLFFVRRAAQGERVNVGSCDRPLSRLS